MRLGFICLLVATLSGCYVHVADYRRDQLAQANDTRLSRRIQMGLLIGQHISVLQMQGLWVEFGPLVGGGQSARLESARYSYVLYLDSKGIILSAREEEKNSVIRGAPPTRAGLPPIGQALPSHPDYNPHRLRGRLPNVGMSGW